MVRQLVRENVWELADPWADPVLWYARGAEAMQARGLAEPTSWRFYGAIHGVDRQRWIDLGYLDQNDAIPSASLRRTFWRQCQHGSWYFLPWHRGYLLAFEANIRAAVVALGGPTDWALPYWNYFKSGQSGLPAAFASPDWPDGQGNNPLFVEQRFGPNDDGNVFVPTSMVNLDAMNDPDFGGAAGGGSPGFGGVDTGFSHGGPVHGGIETQPHDWVHGLVGGQNAAGLAGVMSDPDTAGLDPIFWLHHANIDRLWETWRSNPPETHADPTEDAWTKGPVLIGERAFAMPMPDGTTWTYAPEDMADLGKLDYTYDDLSSAVPAPQPFDRLNRLGANGAALAARGGMVVARGDDVELVGASRASVPITGADVRTSVHLDEGMRNKVSASLTQAAEQASPDRVFLNLENVRGRVDSTAFQVFVGLPDGAVPKDHPGNLAGSIALFGVRKASLADGEHAGAGLTFVLEITRIVDELHLNDAFDLDRLDVRIVPVRPVPDSAEVSIGRISVFRQGG